MKPWMTKIWVRIVAILVFLVMLIMAGFSAAGIAACYFENAYTDGGADLRQDALSYLARRMDRTVADYYFACSDDPENAESYWAPYFSREKTNYFFRLKDANNNVVLSSYTAPCQFKNTDVFYAASNLASEEQHFDSAAKRQAWLEEFSKDHRIQNDSQWEEEGPNGTTYYLYAEYVGDDNITIERFIAKDFQAKDQISFVMNWVDRVISMRNVLPWLCGLFSLIALAALIFLLAISGRRNADGTVRLTWFDRIPLDLLTVVYIGLVGISFAIADGLFDRELLIAAAVLLPVWITLGLAYLMTIAARARAKTIWKNNVITWMLKYLRRFLKWLWGALKTLFKSIPLFWKTLLIWAGISLVELFVLASCGGRESLFFFWFVEKLILTPLILFGVIGLQRLRKGAQGIRGGDLTTEIDTKYLYGPFREHAEDLNAITDGLQSAVDDRVKSERMKAELITNVSHDIKTPLTSIVNYVDLLSKEDLQNERAKEYVSVLTRQSQRLKKLTEDLVEASKASTGNIAVNAAPVDLNVLLSQAAGEFTDRFAAQNLELVLTTAVEQPKITADGQLLWRVFSNLMSNIVKYAMAGTRVYLTTSVGNGTAKATFRNISSAPLNISGDELTERFVRGDKSRTGGEGSGLGLSIARSLTELQGGQFTVTVDGDLFKAELVFPLL